MDTARRVPTKEQCSFYKNIFSTKLMIKNEELTIKDEELRSEGICGFDEKI